MGLPLANTSGAGVRLQLEKAAAANSNATESPVTLLGSEPGSELGSEKEWSLLLPGTQWPSQCFQTNAVAEIPATMTANVA